MSSWRLGDLTGPPKRRFRRSLEDPARTQGAPSAHPGEPKSHPPCPHSSAIPPPRTAYSNSRSIVNIAVGTATNTSNKAAGEPTSSTDASRQRQLGKSLFVSLFRWFFLRLLPAHRRQVAVVNFQHQRRHAGRPELAATAAD